MHQHPPFPCAVPSLPSSLFLRFSIKTMVIPFSILLSCWLHTIPPGVVMVLDAAGKLGSGFGFGVVSFVLYSSPPPPPLLTHHCFHQTSFLTLAAYPLFVFLRKQSIPSSLLVLGPFSGAPLLCCLQGLIFFSVTPSFAFTDSAEFPKDESPP